MERTNEHLDAPMPKGIGPSLKAAREAAGLGLGEVADRLKLSMRQLEAIERDDFDALPGATFVRGFVRNYARFLGVDPEPLMQALEQHFPSAVNDVANLVKGTAARDLPHEPEEAPAESREGSSIGKWLALAVIVAGIAGGGFWYANRDDGGAKAEQHADDQLAPMLTQQHDASAVAASAPAAATPANSPASAAVAAAKPAASSPAQLAAAKPVASAPAKAIAAKPVASAPVKAAAAKPMASAPAAAPGNDKVSVNVKDAAWISVQDATGRKLIYKVMQPGDATEVSGTAPFKVVVGNASQVELSYNGKPVDFSDKIRGTTAKIQLK
ncbi:helix-turn-helix domain-containing protein [Chromobacterium sinusclupearum]|nr:helix-turn-helix domain-containing protein [Chromobacterium sinusclupearum]